MSMLVSLCLCAAVTRADAAGVEVVLPEPDDGVVIIEEQLEGDDLLKQLTIEALEAIYDIAPGAAGTSLRTMIATGRILDLSARVYDCEDPNLFTETCRGWMDENLIDDFARGRFEEGYIVMWENTMGYMENPGAYGGLISDCGYTPEYSFYDIDNYNLICDYIIQTFRY